MANFFIDWDIRTVERDGSNDTLLYTATNWNGGAGVSDYSIHYPLFNYDGTMIAWVEEQDLSGSSVDHSLHGWPSAGSFASRQAGR